MSKNLFTIESYKALLERARKSDLDAALARCQFGTQLLEERKANGGKQLPKGRLDEICDALHLSGAEVHNWMQFAERYPTQEKVANALAEYGSWHEIVRRGLGGRGAKAKVKQAASADEFERWRLELPACAATGIALQELVPDAPLDQLALAEEDASGVAEVFTTLVHTIKAERTRRTARAA